jgi:Rod binding domain-containing protein
MSDAISSSANATSSVGSYLDFSGLGELKGRAQQKDQGALRETAKHFEGMFIQMMLKSMRDANSVMKSDMNHSEAIDTFQDMFDKEISTQMANKNALGIADMLVKQLTPHQIAPVNVVNGKQIPMPLTPAQPAMSLSQPQKSLPIVKPFIKPLPARPMPIDGEVQP